MLQTCLYRIPPTSTPARALAVRPDLLQKSQWIFTEMSLVRSDDVELVHCPLSICVAGATGNTVA